MGEVLKFQSADERESDRLRALLDAGRINEAAALLGTPEEWAWSSIGYLKAALAESQGGALGGSVEVSAAAVGVLLGYVEQLAGRLGIIPPPAGETP